MGDCEEKAPHVAGLLKSASQTRVGKFCAVWSPGASGVWVAAGDVCREVKTGKSQTCSVEKLKQENPKLVQRLREKKKKEKKT